ncbi:hypothetical protein MCZ47_16475 [Bacillus altitudinis]|uniref:hypothetical protein n=1 Tax=Bacillus altitudinis TaxID=293387 RepID=UPI002281D6E9|nr:hypothetical protein [Bacillus altitudinis]MCY7451837.1 hypothetical protein [Bacillus altitudinis]
MYDKPLYIVKGSYRIGGDFSYYTTEEEYKRLKSVGTERLMGRDFLTFGTTWNENYRDRHGEVTISTRGLCRLQLECNPDAKRKEERENARNK